jgi:hypothetical protein
MTQCVHSAPAGLAANTAAANAAPAIKLFNFRSPKYAGDREVPRHRAEDDA